MAGAIRDDDDAIISDINVTPFVDVTLVLLIIFMVTASYIVSQSIPVDLPEAATGEDVVTTLAVTLTKDGTLYVDGAPSDDAGLRRAVEEGKQRGEDVRVVIAADRAVSHGAVVHVIDLVRALGVAKFAINIDPAAARTGAD